MNKLADILLRTDETTSQHILDADYTVIDTKLTGADINKDTIVSVSAVKMRGSKINLDSPFYRVTDHSSGMTNKTSVLQESTSLEVSRKTPIDTVLTELADYCGNDILVGFFISLDMNFINKALKRIDAVFFQNHLVDAYRIYDWIKSGEGASSGNHTDRHKEFDLSPLAREYGIPVGERHNALAEVIIAAQIFQVFLNQLPGFGINSARDLLIIGRT